MVAAEYFARIKKSATENLYVFGVFGMQRGFRVPAGAVAAAVGYFEIRAAFEIENTVGRNIDGRNFVQTFFEIIHGFFFGKFQFVIVVITRFDIDAVVAVGRF